MDHSSKNQDDGASKASRGRPRSNRARDHWVTFRVTAEEHFELMDKARRSGMTAGAYARSRALRGIARRPRAAPVLEPMFGEETRAVFHELRRQGVNLNQIAHHCNRHQVPPPREVAELAAVILGLWQRLIGS